MGKVEIVLKITCSMEKPKTQSKTMKLVAGFPGVISVALEGDDKRQIVVVGEGVDPCRLTKLLQGEIGSEQVSLEKVDKPNATKEKANRSITRTKKVEIVLEVMYSMENPKTQSKTMKLVAGFPGVLSVALEGDDKKQIVVVGEEVDPVCLTQSLRKKIGFTELVSLAPANKKVDKPNATKGPAPANNKVDKPNALAPANTKEDKPNATKDKANRLHPTSTRQQKEGR